MGSGLSASSLKIINLIAKGMSTEEILKAYPYVEADDIKQALEYAAWTTEERVYANRGRIRQEWKEKIAL